MHRNIDASLVKDALDRALDLNPSWGDDENRLTTNYSGRGMYGTECFGITGTPALASLFMVALCECIAERDDDYDDLTLAYDLARNMTMDSMGTSMIFYFPNYTLA